MVATYFFTQPETQINRFWILYNVHRLRSGVDCIVCVVIKPREKFDGALWWGWATAATPDAHLLLFPALLGTIPNAVYRGLQLVVFAIDVLFRVFREYCGLFSQTEDLHGLLNVIVVRNVTGEKWCTNIYMQQCKQKQSITNPYLIFFEKKFHDSIWKSGRCYFIAALVQQIVYSSLERVSSTEFQNLDNFLSQVHLSFAYVIDVSYCCRNGSFNS